MSGLLALLDDVAALAKLAATQLDDVATQAAKASTKAAGVAIDDSAVTPKYVVGLPAAREIPIVAKIARGSLFNKLVILLPAALVLNAFAPWALTPLLMIGGAYLCFEGAEKVWHALHPAKSHAIKPDTLDAVHLEKQRVAGAIKTDFILSAEIMMIALANIDGGTQTWKMAIILALVALGITIGVYGTVALLVKADDFGLKLSQIGRLEATRTFGRGIVKWMPWVMTTISILGTAAMLWVGGSIIVHGLEHFGLTGIGHVIHDIAAGAQKIPGIGDITGWLTQATLDGIFGLIVGLALIPVAHAVINPLIEMVKGKSEAPAEH